MGINSSRLSYPPVSIWQTLIKLSTIILFTAVVVSCHRDNDTGTQTMDNKIIHSQLQQIQHKKIYFGHQSVGNNIINGLKDLAKSYPDVNINFISINTPTQLPPDYFADSYIGENTKPETKCTSFAKQIDGTFSGNLDIAFMKFCYVDIQAESDVESVFKTYQTTIESLKIHYPHVVFIHVTIPLVAKAGGLKQMIKSLLGRVSADDVENSKRNLFNSKLTEHYHAEPIFDLASVESTYPDGQRESSSKGSQTVYSLIPEYTDDGGHLNKKGSQLVALKLLEIIANVSQTR
jgi:hypothetical protein